jgi:DNA helicase-2/ATP-dependent DNA helicase PcrA
MVLSAEQQRFIDGSLDGHSRLLAGPGTGKSFTSVALLERLAALDPKPRSHMITFTRAATKELQGKFKEHGGDLTERAPSTAHSFAMSVLMRADPGATIRMADDWEKRYLIEELVKARLVGAGHKVDIKEVQQLTGEMAAGWESLDHQKLELVDRDPTLALAFLGAWREAQDRLGFLHVSEIPFKACQLLEDREVELDVDVLIVDEFQDLNRAEVRFIELLSPNLRVVAIGDDDQSIYGWRQAAPHALLEFCDTYQAPSFELSSCFRCGESILAPARAVIASAPGRPPKAPLVSSRKERGVFAHLRFPSSTAEFDNVAELIRARVAAGVDPNDIAVLVRSSADKFRDDLLQRLAPHGIQVTNPEWVKKALSETEVRRLLALGRLAVDPEDSIAWLALLATTPGIGLQTLLAVYLKACTEVKSFYMALTDEHTEGYPSLAAGVRRRVAEAVTRAYQLIADLRGEQEGAVLGPGGWGGWLLEHGDPDSLSTDARRVFNEVGAQLVEGGDASLGGFVNQLGPMALDLADNEEGAVRLMTMARSKGLTVNTAIMLAVDDSTLPAPRGNFEEERRILYVAMTRATDFSVVTFAQRRTGATQRVGEGGSGARSRSQFLSGLPDIPAPEDGVTFVARLTT